MFFGDSGRKLTKLDVILMLGITFLYSLVGFYRLGSTSVPSTVWHPDNGDRLVLYSDSDFSVVRYYCSAFRDDVNGDDDVGVSLSFKTSSDGDYWVDAGLSENFSVFQWVDYNLHENVNYVSIEAEGVTSIGEIVLLSQDGLSVDYMVSEGSDLVHDESNVYPNYVTYYDSGYFDEVYYPRTVFDVLNGVDMYETTHPPMGKYIMSIGVLLFGMNPFGWRFMGVLFGVLCILPFYHIVKRLCSKTWLSVFGSLLFCFDGMHYVMMRIGTLDMFVFLFVLLMYDGMLCFLQKDLLGDSLGSCLVPLFWSGLCLGIGASVKWNAIYGGLGLCVLYFGKLVVSYFGLRRDDLSGLNKREKILRKKFFEQKRGCVLNRSLVLSCCCVLFFLLIPFLVYLASFIPVWLNGEHSDLPFWNVFIECQRSMFGYHSNLVSEHIYSSPWYTWPIMLQPMVFSNRVVADGNVSMILCMGNVLVWWFGFVCLCFCGVIALLKRYYRFVFVIVGACSVYLPWMFVSRIAFIYHYFPMVLFLILAIVLFFDWLSSFGWNMKFCLNGMSFSLVDVSSIAFCLVVGIVFVLYFPVFSGLSVSHDYVSSIMRFFDWGSLV